jgi:hypothetical protein
MAELMPFARTAQRGRGVTDSRRVQQHMVHRTRHVDLDESGGE